MLRNYYYKSIRLQIYVKFWQVVSPIMLKSVKAAVFCPMCAIFFVILAQNKCIYINNKV